MLEKLDDWLRDNGYEALIPDLHASNTPATMIYHLGDWLDSHFPVPGGWGPRRASQETTIATLTEFYKDGGPDVPHRKAT